MDGGYRPLCPCCAQLKRASEISGPGGDWAAHVSCKLLNDTLAQKVSPSKKKISFVFYIAEEVLQLGKTRWQSFPQGADLENGNVVLVKGESPVVGQWALHLRGTPKSVKRIEHFGALTVHMHNLTDLLKQHLMHGPPVSQKPGAARSVILSRREAPNSNVMAFQVTASLPVDFTLVFVSGGGDEDGRVAELSGAPLRGRQAAASKAFKERFETSFLGGGSAEGHKEMAAAALSNMLGGMGYFYGSSQVGLPNGPREKLSKSWDAPLFTAVPSRSFFPRGFLWDEGFHHLLISCWEPMLTVDSLAHWLDLLSSEGWIPREQIRGPEAQSRVPSEFIIQRPTAANPPTLFLPILRMARAVATSSATGDGKLNATMQAQKDFLVSAFPRLEKWFLWFNTTQQGGLPGSYRWQGRIEGSDTELNPKTLTSGLDDFPRASHPSHDERHVDLRCWMAVAARALATIGHLSGFPPERVKPYEETALLLEDVASLRALHYHKWSGLFLDWGNHTEDASLQRVVTRVDPRTGQPVETTLRRVVKGLPVPQHVPHVGYVSLFPFLMKLLPPDAPELASQLSVIQDPNHLWTPFGLRSLSKQSSIYHQHNTEHDPPYWRGAIWINVNYLALGALKHYGSLPGPHQEGAATLYALLRKSLLGNIARQYEATGYLWEQYSDEDGTGKGCKPFTGWTALVALIAAEAF